MNTGIINNSITNLNAGAIVTLTSATSSIAGGSLNVVNSIVNVGEGKIEDSVLVSTSSIMNLGTSNIKDNSIKLTNRAVMNLQDAVVTGTSFDITDSVVNMQNGKVTTSEIMDWTSENAILKIDVNLQNDTSVKKKKPAHTWLVFTSFNFN